MGTPFRPTDSPKVAGSPAIASPSDVASCVVCIDASLKGRQFWKSQGKEYVSNLVKKFLQIYPRATQRITAVLFTSLPPSAPAHLTLVQPLPFSSASEFTSSLSTLLSSLDRPDAPGGDNPAVLEALVRGIELLERKVPGHKPLMSHHKHLVLVTVTDLAPPELNTMQQAQEDVWPATVPIMNQREEFDGVGWEELAGKLEANRTIKVPSTFDKHGILFSLIAGGHAPRLVNFARRVHSSGSHQPSQSQAVIRPMERHHTVMLAGFDSAGSPLKRPVSLTGSAVDTSPTANGSSMNGTAISKKTTRFDLGGSAQPPAASSSSSLSVPAAAPAPPAPIRVPNRPTNFSQGATNTGTTAPVASSSGPLPLIVTEAIAERLAGLFPPGNIKVGAKVPTVADATGWIVSTKHKATKAFELFQGQVKRGEISKEDANAKMMQFRTIVAERLQNFDKCRIALEAVWKEFGPATTQGEGAAPPASTSQPQPQVHPPQPAPQHLNPGLQLPVLGNLPNQGLGPAAGPATAALGQPGRPPFAQPLVPGPPGGSGVPGNPGMGKEPAWRGAILWRIPHDPSNHEIRTFIMAMPTQSATAEVHAIVQTWPRTLLLASIRQENLSAVVNYAQTHRLFGLTIHAYGNSSLAELGVREQAGHPQIPGGNEGGFLKLSQMLGSHSVGILPADDTGRGLLLIQNNQQKNLLGLVFHRQPIPATFSEIPQAVQPQPPPHPQAPPPPQHNLAQQPVNVNLQLIFQRMIANARQQQQTTGRVDPSIIQQMTLLRTAIENNSINNSSINLAQAAHQQPALLAALQQRTAQGQPQHGIPGGAFSSPFLGAGQATGPMGHPGPPPQPTSQPPGAGLGPSPGMPAFHPQMLPGFGQTPAQPDFSQFLQFGAHGLNQGGFPR